MFTNYFKFAFRRLIRHRSFSLINILGLAIGITASLLIYRVIENETSYDSYQTKKDQIYRVVATTSTRSNGETVANSGSVPLPLPDAIRLDFPQFEKVAATVNAGTPQVYIPGKSQSDERQFKENNGAFYAEPALFEIFDYTWLAGNASRLKEPNTVVLCKSIAEKYFGNWQQAVGKTIELQSWRSKFLVTGVFQDLPQNTDVPISMAMSYITLHSLTSTDINNSNLWQYTDNVFKTECFLLSPKGQDINTLKKQLPLFVEKYYKEAHDHKPIVTSLGFQPLNEIHLDDRFDTYKGDALPLKELWSLGLIGLFLLLIACINFINLATAQSVNRAKEIGVRKVLGGDRGSLVKQFLGEAALITSMAIILGYILALFALPYVDQLTQKTLSLNIADYPSILLFLVSIGVVITFLAGFYPAFVLSGFHPVEAFRNIKTQTVLGLSVRRSLVVTQFAIAQLLIIGTLVVVRQMNYFRDRPMGFEKKAIVNIDMPSDRADKQKYDYLRQEMLRIPGVIDASYAMDPPSSDEKIYNAIYYENNPKKLTPDFEVQFADTNYLNTFGIKLMAGRLPYPSDTVRELLVNEAAVKALGLSVNQVIGKKLSYNLHKKFPVVGVMHDFNSRSLRDPILPLVLSTDKNAYTNLAVRIEPEKLLSTMPQVQEVFKRIIPTYVYDPVYFDDSIWQYYKKEAITSQLFKIAAVLAIMLSCLGLYGLVSFVVVQKTKEVGIRKILGAPVQSILYLFSKEFIILIAIAFVIAAPVGYYFMHQWLAGFYNHVDLGWGIFALAVFISLAIACITVGYTTFRAAIANPVDSLRSE